MENPSQKQLISIVRECWDEHTSSVPDEWSKKNPARGQCVPTSLVIQDYFGGQLQRVSVTGKHIDESHYFNRLENGLIIDATVEQYVPQAPVRFTSKPVDLAAAQCQTTREYVLRRQSSFARYVLLKARIATLLEETE